MILLAFIILKESKANDSGPTFKFYITFIKRMAFQALNCFTKQKQIMPDKTQFDLFEGFKIRTSPDVVLISS